MEFEGWLNKLEGWDKTKSKSGVHQGKMNTSKAGSENALRSSASPDEINKQTKASSRASSGSLYRGFIKSRNTDEIDLLARNLLDDNSFPTANSEKDLGNEYFKEKKFNKAIECYSRSIALSPTSVAFANRAMGYLKMKRYKEAENDCTEALNLDDRYVKAYSRRATARKELGKLKASLEDSDFAMRLEPNNQELKKLYNETKALYDKEMMKQISGSDKTSSQGIQFLESSNSIKDHAYRNASASTATVIVPKKHIGGTLDLQTPVEELAARASSRITPTSIKNIKMPKSAYEFEVTWRSLSENSSLQAYLLKSIPPDSLPQLFKSALSASLLVDIVKSVATFYKDDPQVAVSILDNLTKVSRFNVIVMCLSSLDRADLRRIWDNTFANQPFSVEQQEILNRLRPKFCPK